VANKYSPFLILVYFPPFHDISVTEDAVIYIVLAGFYLKFNERDLSICPDDWTAQDGLAHEGHQCILLQHPLTFRPRQAIDSNGCYSQ
jgi:hypothetical protein